MHMMLHYSQSSFDSW